MQTVSYLQWKKRQFLTSDFKKNRFFLKIDFEKSPSEIAQMAIFGFIRLQFFYTDKSSELCPRKRFVL